MRILRAAILLSFILCSANIFGQSNQCLTNLDYRIVVLGSSTAAGSGVSTPDSSWVNRYRKYLQDINPNNEVINLAVGGYNTYRIMPTGFIQPSGRPDADTIRNITAAINYDPDAIIVNMPSNDVASGYSIEEQMFNLDSIFQLSAQNNIPIWICTTQPRNFTDSVRQVQADVRDSIYSHFSPYIIDFWSTFALPDNSIDPLYDSGDGVHMNDAAHYILCQRVINTNILDAIFVSLDYTDYTVNDLTPLLSGPCGDYNSEFEIIVSNIGIPDLNNANIYFELTNQNTGSIYLDTVTISAGLDTCQTDTFNVFADTYEQGYYQVMCIIQNQSDTNTVNDTIIESFYTTGHPLLSVFDDTLCSPGTAIISAMADINDTIYWYDNPAATTPIAYGQTFTTPYTDTATIYYAEAIRGNLFYTNSIFTTNNSNINWNGTMFNLVASEDLIIDSFDVKINTTGLQDIEIYSKLGSYLGYELNSSPWTLACSETVEVLSSDQFTTVPIGNINISAGDTVGIYIQLVNSSSTLSYQNISAPVTRSNSEITIITGSGISHNFSDLYYPRDWNGQVYYHYGDRQYGDCTSGKQPVAVLFSDLNFNIGNDTIIDIDDTITFHAPSGMLYYEWFDNSNDSTLEIIASDLGIGIHYISVDVTDSLNCTYSDFLILAVADLASNNGLNSRNLITYPNPTNGIIYFSNDINKVELLNLNGELLFYKDQSASKIDVKHLPDGMYILKIYSNEMICFEIISKLSK